MVHHKELFQSSKQFYQLLKDDTPEGAARLIAFCIELVALHKATQATSQVINAQMPRIKNAFDKIATLAAEEQTLALAGEAAGGAADTSYSSMLKNARNAAEEAIKGKSPLKSTTLSNQINPAARAAEASVSSGVQEATISGDKAIANRPIGNMSNQIGKKYEEYLIKHLGAKGSFKASNARGTREFDGAIGNVWYEAKAGGYWDTLLSKQEGFNKFRSDMIRGKLIAEENHAIYRLYSENPIPENVKQWLTKNKIEFIELKPT